MRVGAQVVLLDLHAGERLRVLEQVGGDGARHVALDDHEVVAVGAASGDLRPRQRHRDRPARAQVVHDRRAHPGRLHVHDPGEPGDLAVELRGGHVHEAEAHGQPRAVVDDDLAVAVDDGAARRHDLDRAQAVVVGLGDELLAAEDLQEPQAEEDDAEHDGGDADHDGDAQRHRRQLDDGPVATAGTDGPVAASRVVTGPEQHADHLPRAASNAPPGRWGRPAAC